MADTRISSLASGGDVTANDRFVAVETPGVGPVIKTGSQLKTWAASTVSDPLNLAQYNGATDCTTQLQAALDYCFGTSGAPHGTTATSNKEFVLPPGSFNISAPLVVTKVHGGTIRGAGRFVTNVINTVGGDVFTTDGFEYSRVSGMRLHGMGSTGTLFNLDWTGAVGVALQSNTFSDMFFDGSGIGVLIGNSGFMGSENLFLNCFFGAHAIAGLKTANFNALQQTIVGGNFQNCGKCIWVRFGSVPTITGVGFQNGDNTAYDIVVDNSAGDTYAITGCRTESASFAFIANGPNVVFTGCAQLNAAAGVFVTGSAQVVIDGCHSINGIVNINKFFSVTVNRSFFDRSDWRQGEANYLVDGVADVVTKSAAFTLDQHFITNSLLVGNGSGAPWTVTIPLEATMFASLGLVIPIGVHVDIIQKDANQITIAASGGVALHTARSLTTRAQYSVISLTKIATDEWVVSGDLT